MKSLSHLPNRAFALLTLTIALSVSAYSQQSSAAEIDGWDISSLDAKIAETAPQANAASASTFDKTVAAVAYLERANFFYTAGVPTLYKLAVGDFRRALRLQPENTDAREALETILSIYKQLGRPAPVNGTDADGGNDPHTRFKVKAQAIRFESGRKFATVSQVLPKGLAFVYEVDVPASKQISLRLSSESGSAVFDIYQESLEDSSRVPAAATKWVAAVSVATKYLIRVHSSNPDDSCSLKVMVK